MSQKILAIGAHPDDIEFGCGAILIKEVIKGNKVKFLVLSRGEAGTYGSPDLREKESRAAAKVAGAQIDFLDFGGDCHISYTTKNIIKLARVIRIYKPELIVTHFPHQNQHPDHVIVGKMVRDAARFARYAGLNEIKKFPSHTIASLYYFFVSRDFEKRPDIIIDISSTKDAWEQMMKCHKSQLKTKRYIELQLSRARTLGLSIGTEYAMGLYVNDSIHLDSLSDIVLSSRNF